MKLSKRLQQIKYLIKTDHYQHIWDCCCDHGLLGLSLLASKLQNNHRNTDNSVIHFVDIVPELISAVEKKLRYFSADNNQALTDDAVWQCHCLDVAKLPLNKYQGKHLVIIAGVGGDLVIKFIEAIHQRHKNLPIDFLLCPVHHQYSLRAKLIEFNFNLLDEVLVKENNRFYELLLVSASSRQHNGNVMKVTSIGNKIWQPLINNDTGLAADTALAYLSKTLKHYQRIQYGCEQKLKNVNKKEGLATKADTLPVKVINELAQYQQVQTILAAYSALLPSGQKHQR